MDREQMIEQRALAIERIANGVPFAWQPARDACRRIARAEIEREAKLVYALTACSGNAFAGVALRDYHAEFAPPPRTLTQVAKDLSAVLEAGHWTDPSAGKIAALATELRAALKRESGGA